MLLGKLDRYILKAFFPIYIGSFFICLFVFMMQMTWRYVNELIGKGLTLDILAEFFGYMAVMLTPMSLPLTILLSMLITFGNLGEKYELLAIKAAGVSLLRILSPLFFVALLTAGVSFYLQNTYSAKAFIKIKQLLISMKQTSPVIEIPEGVFYNQIPSINLFVEKKDSEKGMLYNMVIYKTDKGIENAQIVLADSGRMEMTKDKHYLRLELWSGEQFENLQQGDGLTQKVNVPYDRETFAYKQIYITFDANFNLLDENLLTNTPSAMSMKELKQASDSINEVLDSVGKRLAKERGYYIPQVEKMKICANVQVLQDTLKKVDAEKQLRGLKRALYDVEGQKERINWQKINTEDWKYYIRRFWVEWHNKIVLSLSCLIFFFVGGALGAIIRKGGLGLPTVISVLIFIVYYIFNTSGMKMAKEGKWDMIVGMWSCIFVFAPLGMFLTYKANKDSVVFNFELYKSFFCRLLGLRVSRNLAYKEVVIQTPNYKEALHNLDEIVCESEKYINRKRLHHFPNYYLVFFVYHEDKVIQEISVKLEKMILNLSNSREHKIINLLNAYPVLLPQAHTRPFDNKSLNRIVGIIFPIGLLLSLRMWRFRLRLLKDLRTLIQVSKALKIQIHNIIEE